MFKKQARMNRAEFSYYFHTGHKNHFPTHTVIVAPAAHTKVAVVVGKKVSKLAVRRNRIRRRVFATLYELLQGSKKKVAIIILVKPQYHTFSRKVADGKLRESIAHSVKTA